jgi:hypothetical protein
LKKHKLLMGIKQNIFERNGVKAWGVESFGSTGRREQDNIYSGFLRCAEYRGQASENYNHGVYSHL